jgi:hypothetical protein
VTFGYTTANGAGVFPTPKDEVRFLSRDTVSTQYSISDEEIAYYLGKEGGATRLAAADALDARATTIATLARKQVMVGPFRTESDANQIADGLRALAAALRNGTASSYDTVTIGLADDGWADETPVFDLGMNDAPGSMAGTADPLRVWV